MAEFSCMPHTGNPLPDLGVPPKQHCIRHTLPSRDTHHPHPGSTAWAATTAHSPQERLTPPIQGQLLGPPPQHTALKRDTHPTHPGSTAWAATPQHTSPPPTHLVRAAACQQCLVHLEPVAENVERDECNKYNVEVGVGRAQQCKKSGCCHPVRPATHHTHSALLLDQSSWTLRFCIMLAIQLITHGGGPGVELGRVPGSLPGSKPGSAKLPSTVLISGTQGSAGSPHLQAAPGRPVRATTICHRQRSAVQLLSCCRAARTTPTCQSPCPALPPLLTSG